MTKWLFVLMIVTCLHGHRILGQPDPTANGTDSSGPESSPPAEELASQTDAPVGFYTRSLLAQNISVLGQAVQIPVSLFLTHACQVVYLGNPDWATLDLDVRFIGGFNDNCQPQAFFAYIDGYNGPPHASNVALSSSWAPWAAVVADPNGNANGGSQGGGGLPNASDAPTAPPPPSLQQRRRTQEAGRSPIGLLGRLRRFMGQDDVTAAPLDGLSGSFSDRQTFQSAYDQVRGQTLAAQELLDRGKEMAPGPDGPLSAPIMASDRYLKSLVASPSTYSGGAPKQSFEEHQDGIPSSTGQSTLIDDARVYLAPVDECLSLLAGVGPNGKTPPADSRSGLSSGGTSIQDSCFVSQYVVYLYNPCASAEGSFAGSTIATTTASNTSNSGPAGTDASPGFTTYAGKAISFAQQKVLNLLKEALSSNTTGHAVNKSLGYAQVTVLYKPYNRCVRKGVDMLADVSLQVVLFSLFAFGWLVLLLLLPSLWRLFLEFPFRLILHAIRKLRGIDQSLKPMKPGLHSHKWGGRWRLGGIGGAVLGPVLRFRKWLLYAVVTVHNADGQSRWLQVSVISNVALCIAMAVYAPKLAPPLEHFVRPLALQITRSSDAVASLLYFFTIAGFSGFMGTLGYLSMLANYNSPVNQYYRVQCCLSAFFMILQDLLVLLQVVSLLAQWPYLRPSWPYLPMITFQLANLLAANILQVVIFSKRHDQHNRNVYAAYVAARQDRSQGGSSLRKPAQRGLDRRRLVDSAGSGSGMSSIADEADIRPMVADGEQRPQRLSREAGAEVGDISEDIDVRRQRKWREPGGMPRKGGQPLNTFAGQGSRGGTSRPRGDESDDSRARCRAVPEAGAVQLAVLGSPAAGGGGHNGERPRRRLLLGDSDDGPGPIAEGLEYGGGDDRTDSDPDDSGMALLPRSSRRRSVDGNQGSVPGRRRLGTMRWHRAAEDVRSGLALQPRPAGSEANEEDHVDAYRRRSRLAAGGEGTDTSVSPLCNSDVDGAHETGMVHGKRPDGRNGASRAMQPGSGHAPASNATLAPRITFSADVGLRKRPRKGKGGKPSAGLGRSATTHKDGWWWSIRATARRAWHAVRESSEFRYPAWLLAALLVSGYMVIFHYARALEWSGAIKDCILDPSECATNTLGRYLRFASRLFSRGQQQLLQDALVRLLGTQGDVMDTITGALDPNATNSLLQAAIAPLVNQLAASLSTGLYDYVEPAMVGSLQQSLAPASLEGVNGTGGLAERLTPSLRATLQSALANALANSTLKEKIVQQASAAVTQVATQQSDVQATATSTLNSTVAQLFRTVNVTAGFLNRTLQVEEQVRMWQDGLSSRFGWSSVIGFTLGLMLGLSTLVQTAVSFQRAVRQARRMRVARRMFERLLESSGATGGGDGDGGPGSVLLAGQDSLLSNRALKTDVSLVIFFFGVLMSTAVIQLYMVGVLLSVTLAVLTHPWTWSYLVPRYWLYLVAVVAIIVVNKYVLIGYVGSAFLSNGDHIYRPAAWLAFSFIMSITNLVVGLLLAVYRIALLLLTTLLSLGKLEVTIFTFFKGLDLPHNSFLAGLHLHEAMANFHDPIYLPGPRGAAHRRWRKLRDTVRRLKPEELRLMATLGRPKEVQEAVDHVVVNMHAARALAASSIALDRGSKVVPDSSNRPSVGTAASVPVTGAAFPAVAGSAAIADARLSRSRGTAAPSQSGNARGAKPLPGSQHQLVEGSGRGRVRGQQQALPATVGRRSQQGRASAAAVTAAAPGRRQATVNSSELCRYRAAPESEDEARQGRRSAGRRDAGAVPQRTRRLYDGGETKDSDESEQQPAGHTRSGPGSRSARRALAMQSRDDLL